MRRYITRGYVFQALIVCAGYASISTCATLAQNSKASISKLPTPLNSSLSMAPGLLSVTQYGAHGDGSMGAFRGHDDTKPIQAAIDAGCKAGGGKILIPRGIYNIALPGGSQPRPHSGAAALTIPCNNIVLEGAGPDRTILNFWLIDRGRYVSSSSICPKNLDVRRDSTPRVWRGSAIYIPGGPTPTSPTKNIEIRELRIAGNAEINGNNKNPVTWDSRPNIDRNSDCNAWDTSNKGIYLQNNDFSAGSRVLTSGGYYPPVAAYFDNIHIIDVHIDHFLGELIYEGNRTVINSTIEGSELDHSNGDCISVAGGWSITKNYCHDVAANGFENSPGFAPQTYELNKIQRVQLDGIAITNVVYNSPLNQEYGVVRIARNDIDTVGRNGIVLYDTVHAIVASNSITDSFVGISLYDMGSSLSAPLKRGSRPPEPVIIGGVQSKDIKATLPYQVTICWVYDGLTPFDQVLVRSPASPAKSVATTEAIIKAPPIGSAGTPKPSGWEVYAGVGNGPQYRQGRPDSVIDDFHFSLPLKTGGISAAMLEGTADAPIAAPSVGLGKGGSLQPGTYDIRFAWVSESKLGNLLSPPSPPSHITVPVANSSIVVSPSERAPQGVIGFAVFSGKAGEILLSQSGDDFISGLDRSMAINGSLHGKAVQIPGRQGAILSPNVRDIVIDNNSFTAATKDMHAGVQCCGTPIVWPMAIDITIRNNIVRQVATGHRVERSIATPPEFSTPNGRVAHPIQNFHVVQ